MKFLSVFLLFLMLTSSVFANILVTNYCGASGYIYVKGERPNCQSEYTMPINGGENKNLLALKGCIYKVSFASAAGVQSCTVSGASKIAFRENDCKCRPN